MGPIPPSVLAGADEVVMTTHVDRQGLTAPTERRTVDPPPPGAARSGPSTERPGTLPSRRAEHDRLRPVRLADPGGGGPAADADEDRGLDRHPGQGDTRNEEYVYDIGARSWCLFVAELRSVSGGGGAAGTSEGLTGHARRRCVMALRIN